MSRRERGEKRGREKEKGERNGRERSIVRIERIKRKMDDETSVG